MGATTINASGKFKQSDELPKHLFGGVYQNRRVVVTGQTGFKGSWLTLWLQAMGAEVFGYALEPNTSPSHFSLHDWRKPARFIGDVRDLDGIGRLLSNAKPSIVFHLAAQPLVRESYRRPVETFDVNVLGVANVLEACRKQEGIEAVVVVTSDKVYDNDEQGRAFDEDDRLGGADPYSCSKACAELVTACYRRAFLDGSADAPLVATVRAGNVIGGGDWSADRLIPDAVRVATLGGTLLVRNPHSVRPWQHVLEPLAGYLAVGWRLLERRPEAARAWNFGPEREGHVSVREVVDAFRSEWSAFQYETPPQGDEPHEAHLLHIDSTDAKSLLRWRPVWGWEDAVQRTAGWHRQFSEEGKVESVNDLHSYFAAAAQLGLTWAVA